MDDDRISLADEALAALARARHAGGSGSDVSIRAARVGAARARFLPYVVAGAAIVCGYLSVVAAGEDNLMTVYGAAIAAGIAAGMGVGWLLLSLYQRRAERSATGRRRVDLAIVLLTVPAYVVAGWTSALVGWAVAIALSGSTPETGPPNAWPLVIGAALVIYPISYASARRDTGRPEDFAGAVRTTTGELHEQPQSFAVLGEFLVGLSWFVGILFALFVLGVGIKSVLGSQLDGLHIDGALLGVAFLVVWIGGTAAGTVWTVRRLDRRR